MTTSEICITMRNLNTDVQRRVQQRFGRAPERNGVQVGKVRGLLSSTTVVRCERRSTRDKFAIENYHRCLFMVR